MKTHEYGRLADVYDPLFDSGAAYVRARRAVLGPVWKHVKVACDLCCGTGTFALEMTARGIKTYGVDLSADMLRVARKKLNNRVTLIHGDMRSFRLPERVDLITCEYDSLNHLPRHPDLGRAFRAVARALKPGGWFAFDVNNRGAFESVWAPTWFLDHGPIALVMQGHHQQGEYTASVDVHWFVQKGRHWERHHEHVVERCWEPDEIEACLAAAGFEDVRQWDAAPFFKSPMTRPGNRTFWRARLKR